MKRTLKIEQPHLKGEDVENFQGELNRQFKKWGWNFRIPEDGDYGVGTRSAAAMVVYGLGMSKSLMEHGVTPELRSKIANRRLTAKEKARRAARKPWRRAQRRKYSTRVGKILDRVSQDSWGWNSGHDGIDLICAEDAPIYAIVRSRVLRADTGGWWGKSPSGDVSKGDGIIVLEALESIGPIRKGDRHCYGHAEHPVVKVGEIVKPGQRIGKAGLAVAPHVHFMVHHRSDARGIGDRDPEPTYRYSMRKGR